MSNMLEQAIIDAESLKEAARQSAEEKIVEHFSKDIKEAVNMILEQEEMFGLGDFGTMADTETYDPMAAAMPDEMAPADPSLVDVEAESNTKDNGKFVVDQLPYAATTDSKTFVSIDLDRLEESIRQELDESSMGVESLEEEYELEEEMLFEDEDDDSGDTDGNEDGDGSDEVDDAALEENIAQMIKDVLAEEMSDLLDEDEEEHMSLVEEKAEEKEDEPEAKEETKEKAKKEIKKVGEEAAKDLMSENFKTKNKSLLKEQKTLNKKVHLLEEKLEKYGTVINKLQEKLNETNLANAKLLYQNRVLDSDSLNERQKDRIVETIMNAKTVEEAKIIYETLQSAVGANSSRRKPKSLNEVVTKRSSAFMPRKEEKRVDPFTARMKALAGIKD